MISPRLAGADLQMHYQNHLESVYCISGEGEVENLADGKIYPTSPEVIYGSISMIAIACAQKPKC